MGGDERSGFAETSHNVDNTCRESSLLQNFAEHQRSERSLLCRFDHDCAACCQSWSYLPSHHQERIVPRDDLSDHSNRLFDRHADVGMEELESAALDFIGQTSEVTEHVSCEWDVFIQAHGNGFPIIERFIVGEPLDILLNKVSNFEQNFASLVSVGLPPNIIESLPGCMYSCIYIQLASRNGLPNNLFSSGVDDIKRFPSLRIYKFTINEQFAQNFLQLLRVLGHLKYL